MCDCADLDCIATASCGPGDHTYSWPCVFAPGTGALCPTDSEIDAAIEAATHLLHRGTGHV